MNDEAPPAPKPIFIGLIKEGTSDHAQAIGRYESLKSNSGAGNNLAIIAQIVIVISILIGFIALYDAIVNGGSGNAIETCFGGLFIGMALGAGAVAQSVFYQVQLKEALAEVKASANVPKDEPTSDYRLSVALGVGLCILGVTAQFLMPQTHPDGDEIHVGAVAAFGGGLIWLLVSMLTRS